ncbi:MAG: hypothetical protein LIP02_01265 [Bacteroidales bacterium]|nr:hypothetical protein [Bacteroidales bacterium]
MEKVIATEIELLLQDLNLATGQLADPVAKLMATALVFEAQKIKDAIERIPEKVLNRLCTFFIPQDKIDPMPALAILHPKMKAISNPAPQTITSGTSLSFKFNNKLQLPYCPVFANTVVPYTKLHLVTPTMLKTGDSISPIVLGRKDKVWIGLETEAEVECLKDMSLLIRGTQGVLPKRIVVGNNTEELSFTNAARMEAVTMLPPFDAQQASHAFNGMVSHWKNLLTQLPDAALLYITDDLSDRDHFRRMPYPRVFQQSMESSDLDRFGDHTLWIMLDFGPDYDVPNTIDIIPNAMPVVNVALNSVTLTASAPIAKLTKDDDTYFLKVVETSCAAKKQGFNPLSDQVTIRDFDTMTYNSQALYTDVRNLYNRFIDDYHAFVEYNGLKDGELVKTLRESVNRIGRSVDAASPRTRFDSGVFAMRHVNLTGQASTLKVSYLTTNGAQGNAPLMGEVMENKKCPFLEKDLKVIIGASGGTNKANADERYEMMRYYMMTGDRLFTLMDIDAFLRMQLLKEYDPTEIKRIHYDISVQGAGGDQRLTRGLYIDISFKDEKNYLKAQQTNLPLRLQQLISQRSCLTLPIIVKLLFVS